MEGKSDPCYSILAGNRSPLRIELWHCILISVLRKLSGSGHIFSLHILPFRALKVVLLRNEFNLHCLPCAMLFVLHSVAPLCPTLFSPPDSSVHGILQAGILEWVAMLSSRASSQLRDRTHVSCVSCISRWILYHCASNKESACQCRRRGFNPWIKKIPWRKKWQPIPVFLPGKSHEQRSL